MQIIPVIDLKDQLVVHAQQGNRAQYRPINSKLCPHAEITTVIEAYLSLYPFKVFYLADLDAITGTTTNQTTIEAMLLRYVQLTFWIDSGYQEAPGLYQQFANYLPVLGSESYNDTNYHQLASFQKNYILSLDFAAEHQLGATTIFQQPSFWPQQVIIMNLRQVGSHAGPDLSKLLYYRERYPQHQFLAAGGIRNVNDLVQLSAQGIHTALIASALHAGNISAHEISSLQNTQQDNL